MKKIKADLHIHTVASGHAYSTFKEIVEVAKQKELELIAITDHGPDMPGGASLYHFWNLKALPGQVGNLRILKGVEANIINLEGEIDVTQEILDEMELVIVSFHPFFGYDGKSPSEYTETLLRVLERPYVNVLGHLANPLFPVDLEKVLRKAKEQNVLIELNNSSLLNSTSRAGALELEKEIAQILRDIDACVIVNSDAHYADFVGECSEALQILRDLNFKEENILNFYPDKLAKIISEKVSKI